VALIRAQKALDKLEAANEDQAIGIKILSRAVEEPLRQIVANAGEDAAVVLADVRKGKGTYGYNAATGEYGDLVDMGILDPTKVTRLALQNAASIRWAKFANSASHRCTSAGGTITRHGIYPPRYARREGDQCAFFRGTRCIAATAIPPITRPTTAEPSASTSHATTPPAQPAASPAA
jgi:hypothetical protein